MGTIFKFRIALQDDENIFRMIEMLSTQNLKDLHLAILDAFRQKKTSGAIFFEANENWHKGKKILEIKSKKDEQKKPGLKVVQHHIKHPNQKFVYELEKFIFGAFLVELVGVKDAPEGKAKYPVCTRSSGLLPSQQQQEFDESVFNEKLGIDDLVLDDDFDDFDNFEEF